MPDLLSTLLILPLTLGPVVLMLAVPRFATRARVTVSGVLAVYAGMLALLSLYFLGTNRQLDVINPFFDPNQWKPEPFVVANVEAPGWLWPLTMSIAMVVPAMLLFLRRRIETRLPHPVWHPFLLTVWTFATRLSLELSAAPAPVTWAVGVTIPMLVMFPFMGAWVAERGGSIRSLAISLLLLGLAQRTLVVSFAYFANVNDWGTHLDVSAIQQVDLLLGHRDFSGLEDPSFEQWKTLILIPQYMLFVPATVIFGLLLGIPPFLARRRKVAAARR